MGSQPNATSHFPSIIHREAETESAVYFPLGAIAVKMNGPVLSSSFFEGDPVACARELVGTELIWGTCSGIVVETEAYLTLYDEACHTFTRPSARAFVERNMPGAVYIYLNYGVHWMLNVLVKGIDIRSGLILIRALEPRRGLNLMKSRRGVVDPLRLCSGPGKLAQALNITDRHHEMNLCSDSRYCFRATEVKVPVAADSRIGISRARDFPWRFTLPNSPFVSVRVGTRNGEKPLTAKRRARIFHAQ